MPALAMYTAELATHGTVTYIYDSTVCIHSTHSPLKCIKTCVPSQYDS